MKRFEVIVSLGSLALSAVLLSAIWAYLTSGSLHTRPGIGKAPYNTPSADPKKPPLH